MPGRNSGDNKFGPGPFIVGTVLGDGCNYNTVQSAIDDCFAAGGGPVFVRKGVYIENVNFLPGVELFGFDVDGRLPSTLAQVVIQGNHTLTGSVTFNITLCQYITFSCLSGDLFTVTQTGGGAIIFATKFCGLEAFTDPASRAIVLNPDGASACQFSTDNSNINSASHTFEVIGVGSSSVNLNLGSCNSQTGNVFQLTSGSGSLVGFNTQMNAALSIFNGDSPNGQILCAHTDLFSGTEAVLFPAGNGQAEIRHGTISSGAGSGNFIDGTGGQINYADIVLTGSAINIGASITQIFQDWKPYGSTTNVGVNRYNPADFTVNATTGEVSTIPSGGTVWVDQSASTTVNANEGNFVLVDTISLTLPAAPVQGNFCKFNAPVNATYTIQANVGQILQVGNQTSASGGSAVSSQIGDAMELTYYAAGGIWCANSVVGNWLVA